MLLRIIVQPLLLAIGLFAACLPSSIAHAADGNDSPRPSRAVMDGIAHLKDVAGSQRAAFDPSMVRALLAFVLVPKDEPTAIDLESLEGATSAYFEADISAPLAKVVDYQFNTDFPSSMVMPSSIRLNGWEEKPSENIPSLWKRLAASPDPYLMVRGSEHEEITPDLVTGTYFRYETRRAFIALKEDGRRFFINASVQEQPSQVGRKGVVVGKDQDWNHFYSGIEGVPVTGLGWAKSYIYKSLVVNVLFEPEPGAPLTRIAFFKWLDAGWSGFNMTKRHHLLEGFERFTSCFKAILESPRLPSSDKLIALTREVKNLPEAELTARLKPYAAFLEAQAKPGTDLARKEYTPLLKDGAFLAKYAREEREALLLKEYMKAILGRPTVVEHPAPLD